MLITPPPTPPTFTSVSLEAEIDASVYRCVLMTPPLLRLIPPSVCPVEGRWFSCGGWAGSAERDELLIRGGASVDFRVNCGRSLNNDKQTASVTLTGGLVKLGRLNGLVKLGCHYRAALGHMFAGSHG